MNSSIKTDFSGSDFSESDFSESDFTDPKSPAAGSTNSLLGRLVRFSVIFIIVILFLSIALTSAPKNQDLNGIRDERTILGDKKAKNHYIMMTDIMCPYCDVFSRLAMENQEKFDKYLKDHDIVFEVRVTDFLYENNMDKRGFSRMGAEAIACATDQNRFWDYYHQAIRRLWQDYHSKGIGSSKNAPAIKDLIPAYWESIASDVKLDNSFKSCLSEHKMLETVKQNTADATTLMLRHNLGGMPSFKFNNFTSSGFDTNWDYNYVERYLAAGLDKNLK
mgnify:FL=1